MDEFIDPTHGRMIAVPEITDGSFGCTGCFYDAPICKRPEGAPSYCASKRDDGRYIIWIRLNPAK